MHSVYIFAFTSKNADYVLKIQEKNSGNLWSKFCENPAECVYLILCYKISYRQCDVKLWSWMKGWKSNLLSLYGIPHYWPFVRGIHRWPMDSIHKGPVMLSFDTYFLFVSNPSSPDTVTMADNVFPELNESVCDGKVNFILRLYD